MTRALCVFFILIASAVLAQEPISIKLNGKVSTGLSNLEGVNISNSTNQITTTSDENGFFSLFVKEGDLLVFSAVNLTTLYRRISKRDLVLDSIQIQMTAKSISLKEVVINENSKITAERIGIIPYGQKKYTQAERRLKTAGDFKLIQLLGLLGGSMPSDPIINKLTGRTKLLKKELEVEKKESYLRKLENMFDMDYFMNKLKIPSEYVKGFEYYAVENEKFIKILNSNNKTVTEFLLGELAAKFNEITTSENK